MNQRQKKKVIKKEKIMKKKRSSRRRRREQRKGTQHSGYDDGSRGSKCLQDRVCVLQSGGNEKSSGGSEEGDGQCEETPVGEPSFGAVTQKDMSAHEHASVDDEAVEAELEVSLPDSDHLGFGFDDLLEVDGGKAREDDFGEDGKVADEFVGFVVGVGEVEGGGGGEGGRDDEDASEDEQSESSPFGSRDWSVEQKSGEARRLENKY